MLSFGVVANLLAGRRPPCPCFGSARPKPISGATLVRNAAVAGLAVLATGSSAGVATAPAVIIGVASGALAVATVRRFG